MTESRTACFRVRFGDVRVSVRSEVPDVLEDFADLYRAYEDDRPAEHAVQMHVRCERRMPFGGRCYSIWGDGERIFDTRQANEVFPFLEWGINRRMIEARREFLQLHSAALVHQGRGFIFAGGSGSGKSTLAAGLLARGWDFYSDEFGLIEPETLRLHPFPRALCIKSGSFDIIRELKLPLWQRRHYATAFKGRMAYIRPPDAGTHRSPQPAPVRCIVFPRYAGTGRPRLREMARSEAAFELARHALNRNAHGDRSITMFAGLVRQARCVALDSGPLAETIDLIESLSV